MTEEKKEKSGEISRREFLKDAGLVVGGAAIGSTVLLAACGGEGETATVTKTVTTTAPGGTATVTTTAGEVTKTVTETVSKFICPYDGQEFDTLAALQAHIVAEHPTEVVVVPEELTKLVVNGDTYELQVEPNWTLANVLRDKLGLTGTKVACNRAECGTCTVLMDGQPRLSCTTLAVEANGSDITTIEGLADGFTLHPIQEAFLENFGTQCGFCAPGILMISKNLLDENPNPTETDVREALAGNLCRCTAYIQIITSVLAAAKKI